MWDKFLDQTSKDGFTHNKHRNLSPQNKRQNTQGKWDNFMNKTSQDGFYQKNLYAGKQKGQLPQSHFEGGRMVVQVNDEGGLWNRKPLIKHNISTKNSRVFDSALFPSSKEEITQRYQKLHFPESTPRGNIKRDYDRYYDQDTTNRKQHLASYSKNQQLYQQQSGYQQQQQQNSQQNAQQQYQQQQQQQHYRDDFDKKVKQRKALPTPKYMQEFLQYKKQNDCLKL